MVRIAVAGPETDFFWGGDIIFISKVLNQIIRSFDLSAISRRTFKICREMSSSSGLYQNQLIMINFIIVFAAWQ